MLTSNMDPALVAAAKNALPVPPGVHHGIALPGSQKPGYTAVYRNYNVGSKPLPTTVDPKITTMHEAFESASTRYPDNRCLGWREKDAAGTWGPFVWMDYMTVQERRKNLGVGIVHLEEELGIWQKEHPVGLWAQNRPEWQITDLACMSQSLFTVSIYDTLGAETTEYILNHAELTTVVASLNHVPALLSLAPKCPTLKLIISMDPLDAGEAPGFSKKALLGQWAQEKGVYLYSMAEVEAIGRANPRPMVPPTRDNYITINYTSGTTGNPKGALLTHGNCIAAASCAMSNSLHPMPSDVLLSYLPLAHIYARVAENYSLWGGAAIGYFHGNILEIADDLKALRPTTFISVPRLYNRFYNGIKEATIEQPGVKGALSRHVLSKKLEQIKAGGSSKHAIYDRIWAKKVQAALGFDRCRAMVTGSAPIAKDVLQTLRAVFSNDFFEGYGLTETYAVALGQTMQDNSAGNCGPPTISVECKLRDVPEMGYLSTDKPAPRGELLVRGPSVFVGYFKNPEMTAAVIDEEGWFATGDICSIDELGRFAIIDRVKNLLKLAQGEYVSPEKIENIYIANLPFIGYCLVHGDSLQTYLVAIIGVDRDQFSVLASKVLKRNVSSTDDKAIAEACAHKAVRRAVLKAMDSVAKKAKLAGFERVKNVHLCVEPFTIDNDLLTPTLKMKRPPVVRKFREVLDGLYAEVEARSSVKAKL